MSSEKSDRYKDIRSAYDMPEPRHDRLLTDILRGTQTGEMLRRYWHPIELSKAVGSTPLKVRVLGEDLILFRTRKGVPGLLYPRCCHRGTTLYYGRTEDVGIRCCYHGWLFDPEGRCLEQPCEPEPNDVNPYYRQPWYPVEERYGLVFAYLGPPDKKPLLPRYDVLENLAGDEILVSNGDSVGSGGSERMHCNWFQTHENVMDPYHVLILHSRFSSEQFTPDMGREMTVTFHRTTTGLHSIQLRTLEDGTTLRRQTELVLPNVRIVADPRLGILGPTNNVAWTLPIDEVTTRIFTVFRFPKNAEIPAFGEAAMYGGKTWHELDEAGHQKYPGDYEAQVGQGEITLHSEEHLGFTDEGVRLFRDLFKQAVKEVAAGNDPMATFRSKPGLVQTVAGNFIEP